ncbi:MAG TPA: hypothetical protein DEB40_05530, partial [Elusimicrobia bacterium]|nr:hypothetical protein [Elusimicrobiota bacterium]
MSSAREYAAATLLPDGKVFVGGGSNGTALSTADLYDPSLGAWSVADDMSISREFHTATLLPNGKVLVAGGWSGSDESSAELFNPSAGAGTWSTTNPMSAPRQIHSATLLPNGKVLVAGGLYGSVSLDSVELYDPSAGTWSTAKPMKDGRYGHSATLLPNGKLLVAGGFDAAALSVAELYDPLSGAWSTTNPMVVARNNHSATLLRNGKVLVAGGWGSGAALSTAEVYDPASGTWSATNNSMSEARENHVATLLPDGKVLVAGGYKAVSPFELSSADLYDPAANTWSPTDSMTAARDSPTATLLPNGKVLVAGGYNSGSGYLSSSELYDPAAGMWSSADAMNNTRRYHAATLLPNGKVLVAGGKNGGGAGGILFYTEQALYTEYDFALSTLTVAARPGIIQVNGSASPASVYAGSWVSVSGSTFTGLGGGSGGASGNASSAANLPRAYLRAMDSGNNAGMTEGPNLVDVSSSIYQNSFSSCSLQFQVPAVRPGYYHFWVQSNAVPSSFTVLNVQYHTPANLGTGDVFITSITAQWQANGNPNGTLYELDASTASDFSGVVRSSLTYGLSATVAGLKPYTLYYFRVNAGGSGFTSWVSARTAPLLPGCPYGATVKHDGGEMYAALQDAVDSLDKTLAGPTCVLVKDSWTYAEQVTIEGFANQGSSLTLMAANGARPVVDPVAASTAAFVIRNASVNVVGIDVKPTGNTVAYGIYASSAYVRVSSVNVDSGNMIGTAGIRISSWSVVSHTSVTVQNAHGFYLPGSTMTAISYSTAQVNSGSYFALYLNTASSNTFSSFFGINVNSAAGSVVKFVSRSNYNTVSFSTFTSNATLKDGRLFHAVGSSSNTIIRSNLVNLSGGGGVFLEKDGHYNAIRQSSIRVDTDDDGCALNITGSSGTAISDSFISNPHAPAYAAYLFSDANYNTISRSTITSNSGPSGDTDPYAALYMYSASSNTFEGNYIANEAGYGVCDFKGYGNTLVGSEIRGSTAAYVKNSSNTVIDASVLVATKTAGSGLWLRGGNVYFESMSSVFQGGPRGSAILIDEGSSGVVELSSNTIRAGSQYGIRIRAQSVGAKVWLTSNTIIPALSDAVDTYGVYLDGLVTGATVYNNSIVYRTSNNHAGKTAYGLYAIGSTDLNIRHNRISYPGADNHGSVISAYFQNAADTDFQFNDVNSSGTGLTNAYLLQLNNSTVTVRNNIFLSSWTVTSSSASLYMNANSGVNSDYNDWFSSNALTFIWGTKAYQGVAAWQGVKKDTYSFSANPFWHDPSAGVEDFHPLSIAGRYHDGSFAPLDLVDSPTIDRADPALGVAGLEPDPNGGRANQGSYGLTAEASLSSSKTCAVEKDVCKSGCAYSTIQSALDGIAPKTLSGYTCVIIKDAQTYSEQVTIQGFTSNGSSLTIMGDAALPGHPIVNPPAQSTAAFQVMQASVNIFNIDVIST